MSARPSIAPLQARVQVPGAALAYELTGPQAAPVVVLAHGLGADLRVWDANVGELCKAFRVLRFDLRGHGRSSTPPSTYSLHALAQDTMGLIDYLQLGHVDFVGVDIGARIGLHLAARSPNRLRRLVACGLEWRPPHRPHAENAAQAKAGRMDSIAAQTLAGWLSPGFRTAHPDEAERLRNMLVQTRAEGWIGCAASLAEAPQVMADGLRVPTLLVEHAEGNFEFGRRLVSAARCRTLPGRAHLAPVEQAERFNRLVQRFLLDEEPGKNEQPEEIR